MRLHPTFRHNQSVSAPDHFWRQDRSPLDSLVTHTAERFRVVEFLGLPGSGKTSLTQQLTSGPNFSTPNTHCPIRLVRKAIRLINATVSHPQLARALYTLPTGSPRPRTAVRQLKLASLERFYLTATYSHRKCTTTYIIDDGVLQLAWGLAVRTGQPCYIDRLLHHLYCSVNPDTYLLVYLDMAPSVCLSRVRARNDPNKDENVLANLITHDDNLMNYCVDLAERSFPVLRLRPTHD